MSVVHEPIKNGISKGVVTDGLAQLTCRLLTDVDIYKARWQVELFFKWIKQNLKIKSFIGTSKDAVMTQIWAALCV